MTEGRDFPTKSKDGVARLLGVSALVLSFCVFIAVLVLTPWTLFRVWETSDKMFEKLDAERFMELQAKVNLLEHKIMLMEVAQMKAKAEDRKPVVFRTAENATTNTQLPDVGVVARNRRSVGANSSRFYDDNGSGTVYTRWGRATCPHTASTSILYTGIVGVSYGIHTGGGSNHQCLPSEPEYGYDQRGQQYATGVGGSLLSGVEFKADNIYPFDNSNNRGNTLNTEDAVCTVCFVRDRSVTVMIPARKTCPEGWTLEYKGYLMASHFKRFRVDYICVDEAPEAKQSGKNTSGGSFLYPVEGQCGALPCPNYSDGSELACVVCTH